MRPIFVDALPITFVHFAFLLACAFTLYSQDVHASWLFGPGNFEECISKYQREAASEMAARAIHMACDMKFTQKVDKRFADCILEHVGNTRSDLAVRAIVEACSNLYKTNQSTEWSRCILKDMPGVAIDSAARSIAGACSK